MSNNKRIFGKALIALAFGLLSLCGQATADGGYFPEKAVKKMPSIPAQRALLVWKEGKETLVISSSLDSEAQKLGWIIPLPSVPDTVEKVSPGALKTLTFCLQPEITHDLGESVTIISIAVGLFLLIFGACVSGKRRVLQYAVALTVCAILIGMLMPALARARQGSGVSRTSQVAVERSARVGSYDVAILKAESSGDLSLWLSENGYTDLPKKTESIVSGYIDNGWVFAAIKLVRSEKGANTPHPIRIELETSEPVYPMKLTSIAGGETLLEVFVLADRRASTDMLDTEFCDSYRKVGNSNVQELADRQYFQGETYRQNIGHGDIVDLMWTGCVLTKLSGSVPSSAMTEDMRFDWQSFRQYRRHLYSGKGAFHSTLILLILLGGTALSALMVVARRKSSPDPIRIVSFLKLAEPYMVCVLIVCGTFYSTLPKLPGEDARYTRAVFLYRGHEHTEGMIHSILDDNPSVLGKPAYDIAAFLEEQLRALRQENEILGGEVVSESSPGNFTVEKTAEKIVMKIYDHMGRASVSEYERKDIDHGQDNPPTKRSRG